MIEQNSHYTDTIQGSASTKGPRSRQAGDRPACVLLGCALAAGISLFVAGRLMAPIRRNTTISRELDHRTLRERTREKNADFPGSCQNRLGQAQLWTSLPGDIQQPTLRLRVRLASVKERRSHSFPMLTCR